MWAVFGGVAQVGQDRISIYSTIAQRPDEIDLERALEDRMAVEEALAEEREDHMTKRLQVMQYRALVRLHVGNNTNFLEDGGDDSDSE